MRRTKRIVECKECGNVVNGRGRLYCSNKCQIRYQQKEYVKKWRDGTTNGNRGILTKNISKHLKRFLIETHGEKCSLCSWNTRHPLTNVVPIEVDHKDGNADNNSEENLRLLCPNCHALTPNFRNLNKGRGRSWRK